jgi:hypothetical protein
MHAAAALNGRAEGIGVHGYMISGKAKLFENFCHR